MNFPEPPINESSDHFLGFSKKSWFRATKEGMWVVAGQVVAAIAGLVGYRVLTELLPEKQVYGEASLLLGLVALGRNIFLSPISNAQLRFHPEYAASGQLSWFTGEMARLAWKATGVFIVVTVLGGTLWALAHSFTMPVVLVLATVLLIGIEAPRTVRLNWLSAERIRSTAAVWTSLETVLMVAGSAIGVAIAATAATFILGRALSCLMCLIIFGYLWYPKGLSDQNEPNVGARQMLLARVLRYGLPFLPLALASWTTNLSDRYFIGAFLNTEEVGSYAPAYGLASQPFLMVGGIMSAFARPILFQAESAQNPAKADRVFALWILGTGAISAVGVAAFAVFGERVAHFLLAAEYRRSAPAIFLWAGIAYSFLILLQVVENRHLSFGNSRRLVMPAIVAGVFNVLLNLILIPAFGIVGAAQATAGSFALQLLLLLVTVSSARALSRQQTH